MGADDPPPFSAQTKLLGYILNFKQNSIDKVSVERRTLEHFQNRLTLLENYWDNFFKTDALLSNYESHDDYSNHEYFIDELFVKGECSYISAKTELQKQINTIVRDNAPAQLDLPPQTHRGDVSVPPPMSHSTPKIDVPIFDGTQGEWDAWKELFTAVVIDDIRIPDAIKLRHLLAGVGGPAKVALKGVSVTTSDFKVAWEKLLRRYDITKHKLYNHLENFINLPSVTQASATDLSLLVDSAEELVKGLTDLKCPVKEFDIWFVHLIERKLDPDTKLSWAIHEEKVETFSTYKNLLSFLECRISSLKTPKSSQNFNEVNPKKVNKLNNSGTGPKQVSSHVAQNLSNQSSTKGKKKFKCQCCSENHSIFRCRKFLDLNADNRLQLIKSKKMCECCFSTKHPTQNCSASFSCSISGCQRKHHYLLHRDTRSPRTPSNRPESDPASFSNGPSTESASMCSFTIQPVLLATARIILKNRVGESVVVNALVDQGSMRSFVTKKIVSALNLSVTPTDMGIKGVGDITAATTKGFCRLTLSTQINRELSIDFSALILGQLTSQLPREEVQTSNWAHLENLELADPQFRKPKDIDCILGADIYSRIILNGIKTGPADAPMAQNTRLGWIIMGASCPQNRDCLEVTTGACISSFFINQDLRIADALAKFWEIEKIPPQRFMSAEDSACEEHFVDTVFRADGRYGVRLPFKSKPYFPGSKEIALKSLSRLQTRLNKNEKLKVEYDNFMSEYYSLGHMELVPPEEVDKANVYYIPHHAVFHNGKIRVVFNASMPAFNGLSLNATLHTGPKLQQDIVLILIKWRTFKVVFTCDIVKMFRQILIDPRDRDWLRVVYDFGNKLLHFRLSTVTYGTACAPYQSLRVLLEILTDHGTSSPEMVELFRELSYVDDFFAGADTVEKAIEIRDKLINTLKRAKIELSKWSANLEQVLSGISNVASTDKPVRLNEISSTLGLKWSSKSDSFSFGIELQQSPEKGKITKRRVLSESSKLFDPLGWVSPTLISFKIFLQDLWIDGLDWDTPLSPELTLTWETIRSHLSGIKEIQIPRWLGCDSLTEWSLHGFADASKRAYAACLYFVPTGGNPTLICAKTKVAPVNTISVTKLELSAAVLLAKLIEYALPAFKIKPLHTHCWSDSRNVLCMLKIAPAKLKVFEANRVSDIITTLPNVRWKYVPTNDNPADCATRGMSSDVLKNCTLWWSGPTWLQNELAWPNQLDLQRSVPAILNATMVATQKYKESWLDRSSSLSKLTRVISTAKRWLPGKKGILGVFTAEELRSSRLQILQFDQSLYFAKEIDSLKANKPIQKRSILARLKPFLHSDGLLRVGSRLQNCPYLTFEEKFPIILSRYSSVAKMIVLDYHKMLLHAGPQLVLSAISRKYFIICGKRVITSLICKCITCVRYSGRCLTQQMAPLPADRLEFTYPFAATGLDYAGPIKVTPSRGRGITSAKGYICIFVCLVTKAVHVEIVSDLTTKAFIAAFNRFTMRRGLPKSIRSDNGKTLVGAEREIAKLFKMTSPQFQEIQQYVNNIEITWSFSPPYGPHFGGIWEAAVKSFKFHYKRVLGETPLTFEEHSTLASQIEGCLNSRPIAAISTDSRDPMPLTPGHFLIGRPIHSLPPDSDTDDLSKTYANRFTLLLAMRNSFWKTWKKEVLHQLIQYNKWYFPQRNLQVSDIVILKDETTPATYWPLGRVTAVETDRAGLVRVATVKTASAEYVRPIHKLILLPISNQACSTYHSFLNIMC